MTIISRRYFFFGLSAMQAVPRAGAAPARPKTLLCLIDGFDPAYIARSEMPFLKKLMHSGVYREGQGVMPSLTNVNSASFATGSYPETHGITANTFYDPALKQVVEMAVPRYLMAPTVFTSAHARGWKTAFVGAKQKIRSLIGASAGSSISAEERGIPMYQPNTNYWVMEQGRAALKNPDVDLLYLTTSDYMMHTYAPEQAQSLEHLHRLDQMLAAIVDDHPKLELYLCADHGMNAKTVGIDPVRVLAEKGVSAREVAAIADKHKVHHKDLGGSIYVDLETPSQIPRAQQILAAEPGIEEVLTRTEACRRFHLMPARTGDLYILAGKDTALGQLDSKRTGIKIRTHGSLHELRVPLLAYGRKLAKLETTLDLTATRPWEQR